MLHFLTSSIKQYSLWCILKYWQELQKSLLELFTNLTWIMCGWRGGANNARKIGTNMLEIGGDSWGWQKWESLWEPIDDDLYLRRGRCSSNTRQLAHNNNWMGCQYQTNKHNSNWTSNKQWKKSDLRLFFSPQLQDPKEKWKETSACVSLEQVWDSEMRWARCHMKVSL